MKKYLNLLLVAILFCGMGCMTSCSGNEDNPTEADLFASEMTAALADAHTYGPQTEAVAKEVASRYNGYVTEIDYKSRESATRKCITDNCRPYDLKDLARTTIASQSACPRVRLRCFAITLLLYVLYGHHRQVITLLSIAHKLMDGLCHQTDKLLRLLLLLGESLYGHIVDTFHLKQLKVGTRRLGQSIGEEEDGGVSIYLRLLQRVVPVGHDTYRYVAVTRQLANTCTYEQRRVMACIAIVQHSCRQVEHTYEEGDKHIGLVHVGNHLIHDAYDAVRHRLMGRSVRNTALVTAMNSDAGTPLPDTSPIQKKSLSSRK